MQTTPKNYKLQVCKSKRRVAVASRVVLNKNVKHIPLPPAARALRPRLDLLKRYQSLVGALLYCATNTRPDIAYAVAMLCRAMGK